MSGVILKLGGYGFILVSPCSSIYSSLVMYLSLLGGLVCSLLCFVAWDTKCVVAYSSIIHIGVVCLGVVSGLEIGYHAAIAILISHSLVSPLLFCLAYYLYQATSSRCFILGHRITNHGFLLFFLAIFVGLNFGLPPSIAFWVEVAVFSFIGCNFLGGCVILAFVAFFSFLFCVYFYIRSAAGSLSRASPICFSYFQFLPSLVYSFLLCISGSLFSF